jgi:hypothetical protein
MPLRIQQGSAGDSRDGMIGRLVDLVIVIVTPLRAHRLNTTFHPISERRENESKASPIDATARGRFHLCESACTARIYSIYSRTLLGEKESNRISVRSQGGRVE